MTFGELILIQKQSTKRQHWVPSQFPWKVGRIWNLNGRFIIANHATLDDLEVPLCIGSIHMLNHVNWCLVCVRYNSFISMMFNPVSEPKDHWRSPACCIHYWYENAIEHYSVQTKTLGKECCAPLTSNMDHRTKFSCPNIILDATFILNLFNAGWSRLLIVFIQRHGTPTHTDTSKLAVQVQHKRLTLFTPTINSLQVLIPISSA